MRPKRGRLKIERPRHVRMDDDTTRSRVLAAARMLFSKYGYDATSIRDITTAADVNLGAVTYYFESKHLLYTSVLSGIIGPLARRIESIGNDALPPLEKIDRVVRAFFDHFAINPDMPSFMMRELSSGQPPSGPIQALQRTVLGTLSRVIAEGQARGEIRAGDPAMLTFSVIAQPVHLYLARHAIGAITGLDVKDQATVERIIEHVTATVRRSLENR